MNEQQARDDERRKIIEFLQHIEIKLLEDDRQYDAGWLNAIIAQLLNPNWVKDTEGH